MTDAPRIRDKAKHERKRGEYKPWGDTLRSLLENNSGSLIHRIEKPDGSIVERVHSTPLIRALKVGEHVVNYRQLVAMMERLGWRKPHRQGLKIDGLQLCGYERTVREPEAGKEGTDTDSM